MTRHIFTAITVLLCAMESSAQSAGSDSLQHYELKEVVIQAPVVIRKADMDVYHPSKSAVENSRNGIQLLSNLMIPSLSVNEALGMVMADGESVQVRINGRESSIDQIRALLPETIKRVEWIDNPGLKYRGANYVLNFIVTNPTLGGSVMASAQPSVNQGWGFYWTDVKFNNGRSQWQIGGDFHLLEDLKVHRSYTETFTYPDGESLTRDETSRGGYMNGTRANARASYSYVRPDTTVFLAEFKLHQTINGKEYYSGILSMSNGDEDILLTDQRGNKGGSPSLSLYWQQNLPSSQIIVVNANGSFFLGRTFSDYLEQYPEPSAYITDIHTNIKDRNQAYTMEADYIKNWSRSKFTAGTSYKANLNRSKYESSDGRIFHQRQDKVYLFAEYFNRFGKCSATVGMGVQYNGFRFRESNNGKDSWSPCPQATFTYSLNQSHKFRLSFSSRLTSPSLAETNIVPQQIDGLQWRVGNQDLRTAKSYTLKFRYGFNFPRVNGSFGVRAFSSPDAITPLILWKDYRLIITHENSRGLQNLTFSLAPQIDIVPGWLMASGSVQYKIERMRGSTYARHNNSWSGNAAIQLMHWGFVLSGHYIKASRDLWGETITWEEDYNVINLNYNWKAWQFGAGILMPFGEYDSGSISLNRWNRNEKHIRPDMRVPYISVSYNVQWGRQKRSAKKLVDIDTKVDQSAAGGR